VRPGLDEGVAARVDAVVTEEMVATLGGRPVHPMLATARMIEWMEWASRVVILPFLDPHEDAVGYAVSVVHRRPTRVGQPFWAVARFDRRDGTRIVTRVTAYNGDGLIGEGEVTQVLVPRRPAAP
jgi:predicted thioesterase